MQSLLSNRSPGSLLRIALLALAVPLAAHAQSDSGIKGAGSSAAAPVYRIWANEYAKQGGPSLAYDPVGSGAGIVRIQKREADFGASDFILPGTQLQKDDLVMFPTVITGVVPVVNVPGVASNSLRLDGDVLARIFLGEITQWDAPEIRALNPALKLPAMPIRPVVRADGSGTTYHFSDYLSRVNPRWKQRFGVAPKFNWGAYATAVSGSSDLSKAVRATVGAIGYIDYNYVLDDSLCAVSMKNADGRFVTAGVGGFRQAVFNSQWFSSGDFSAELNNAPGSDTWPITMGTYIALPRVARQGDRAERAVRFITWAFVHGDDLAKQAKFVPLPEKVQASAYREIAKVTSSSGELLGLKVLSSVVH